MIYWGLKRAISSAYSPVMVSTTHVLDAAVKTINSLHKQDAIDFGISLGDACNSTQYNELRWYLDTLDGKAITPSSGAHAGAETIDYQKPYQTVGLDKSIPWYQTIGNHGPFLDGLGLCGRVPPSSLHRRRDPQPGKYFRRRALPAGGSTWAPWTAARKTAKSSAWGRSAISLPPPKVAADPNRRSLLRTQWMGEFFNTASQPVGHGFSQDNVDQDFRLLQLYAQVRSAVEDHHARRHPGGRRSPCKRLPRGTVPWTRSVGSGW